jgi:hypothetical protein
MAPPCSGHTSAAKSPQRRLTGRVGASKPLNIRKPSPPKSFSPVINRHGVATVPDLA